MKKVMEKIGETIRHNKGQAVAVLLIIGLVIWTIGCESKIGSILDPDREVTRQELELEVEQAAARIERETTITVAQLNAQIEQILARAEADAEALALNAQMKIQQLDRQDAVKQKIAEVAVVVAEGGSVNPIGLAIGCLGIFGIGAVVDNQKKDGLLTPNPATS